MSREVHAGFWGSRRVRSPPATHQPGLDLVTRFLPAPQAHARAGVFVGFGRELYRWVDGDQGHLSRLLERGTAPLAGYTAFAGTPHELTARLVVRRVRRDPPPGQDELLPAYRYHAFVTDTTLSTVDADQTHRAHAVIEQVFADLIDGPLAHLPSGRFAANAAWLTRAAISHNLLRAAAALTSRAHARARGSTLRRRFIHVAAEVTCHARGVRLRLPRRWRWAGWWMRLFDERHRPGRPVAVAPGDVGAAAATPGSGSANRRCPVGECVVMSLPALLTFGAQKPVEPVEQRRTLVWPAAAQHQRECGQRGHAGYQQPDDPVGHHHEQQHGVMGQLEKVHQCLPFVEAGWLGPRQAERGGPAFAPERGCEPR